MDWKEMNKEERILLICKIKTQTRNYLLETNNTISDFYKEYTEEFGKDAIKAFAKYIKNGHFNHLK